MPRTLFRLSALATIAAFATTGCSVAPSKTARGAGIGATGGLLAGSVVGPSVGMNSGTAALGGAAAGAVIGGIVGMIQEANENREQENLAMERAYMTETAKRRAEQAKQQAILEEELEISQGFRISELELQEARRKAETTEAELKALMEERSAARAKKKELDELEQKHLDNIAKIDELKAELARLKGDAPAPVQVPTSATPNLQSAPVAPSGATRAPAAGDASSSTPAVRPGL